MGVQILRQGRETEEGEKKWGVKVLRWSVEWRKVSQKKDVGLRFEMEKWAGKEWLEKLGIGFWIRIVYIRDVI